MNTLIMVQKKKKKDQQMRCSEVQKANEPCNLGQGTLPLRTLISSSVQWCVYTRQFPRFLLGLQFYGF